MSISATLVKELREKTNAGMMDCKKALEATNGDFAAAVEWLRVKGLSSAAKKADRVAAEGLVYAKVNGDTGVVIEINSETDFVARNENFKSFVTTMADHVLHTKNSTAILEQKYFQNPAATVADILKEQVATIGENIVIRRAENYTTSSNGIVHTYIHGDGKIGVMVEVVAPSADVAQKPEVRSVTNDIALHIAAMNPMAISSEQIPTDVVSKEREILAAKNRESGKPEAMIEKIVEGQIRKFLAENCLVDQPFVKNPDVKVGDLLKETGKKAGGDLKIKRFIRYELGAGIEKKSNDFAAEVAAQMKGH